MSTTSVKLRLRKALRVISSNGLLEHSFDTDVPSAAYKFLVSTESSTAHDSTATRVAEAQLVVEGDGLVLDGGPGQESAKVEVEPGRYAASLYEISGPQGYEPIDVAGVVSGGGIVAILVAPIVIVAIWIATGEAPWRSIAALVVGGGLFAILQRVFWSLPAVKRAQARSQKRHEATPDFLLAMQLSERHRE